MNRFDQISESVEVFETPEAHIIGIFVLPKYGNELELVTSIISFNSVSP